MKKTPKDQILAESSAWVAFTLNLLPGLGTGYIYQRRWKAYWITFLISAIWIVCGLYLVGLMSDEFDPAFQSQDQISLFGLILIALITAIESADAVIKAREQDTKEEEKLG